MTPWTSGIGRACGVLLDGIVRLLALSRINPNVLTLMGLVVNTYAAFLFGYANGDKISAACFSMPGWSSLDRDSSTWWMAAWRVSQTR